MTADDPVQQKFGFSFAKNEGSEKLMGFQFEFASIADSGNNQPAKKAGWLLTGCMEKPIGLIGDEGDLVLGENTWSCTKRDGKLKVKINDGESDSLFKTLAPNHGAALICGKDVDAGKWTEETVTHIMFEQLLNQGIQPVSQYRILTEKKDGEDNQEDSQGDNTDNNNDGEDEGENNDAKDDGKEDKTNYSGTPQVGMNCLVLTAVLFVALRF